MIETTYDYNLTVKPDLDNEMKMKIFKLKFFYKSALRLWVIYHSVQVVIFYGFNCLFFFGYRHLLRYSISLQSLLDHLNSVIVLESGEERLANVPGHGSKDTLNQKVSLQQRMKRAKQINKPSG
jgi:hypothetical protein